MSLNPFKTIYNYRWWESIVGSGFDNPFPVLAIMFVYCWTFGRLAYGIFKANEPEHCRIQSIGDVIITPMYAIGCNIGKDRFDIKIN